MGKSIVGPREQTLGYAFNARAPMPVGALKERARPSVVAPSLAPISITETARGSSLRLASRALTLWFRARSSFSYLVVNGRCPPEHFRRLGTAPSMRPPAHGGAHSREWGFAFTHFVGTNYFGIPGQKNYGLNSQRAVHKTLRPSLLNSFRNRRISSMLRFPGAFSLLQ